MAASHSLSSAHLLFPSHCRDGDARRQQYALARDSRPFVVCAARSSRAGESTFNSFCSVSNLESRFLVTAARS